jgi:chemotaxis protein MotB
MKKKKHEEHENMERWLVSYADFITLLFAFFVVMYSTSSTAGTGKYRAMSDSISESFNPIIGMTGSKISLNPKASGTHMFDIGLALYFQKTKRKVNEIDPTGKIQVVGERRGLVIRIADSLAFEPGEAEISPGFNSQLDEITDLISTLPHAIRIEGHTDNIPIKTERYPSNWELSTARAVSILRALIQRQIDPQRLSIAGYGEFRPIAENTTLEGRAKNRRVEIIILNRSSDESVMLLEGPRTPEVTEMPEPPPPSPE